MQHRCEEAADKVRGASGRPVMVDSQIIGILANQLLENSYAQLEAVKLAFHALYALPIEVVRSLLMLGPSLKWRGPSAAEILVRGASQRTQAEAAKRITTDGKYPEARYVEREGVSCCHSGHRHGVLALFGCGPGPWYWSQRAGE